MNKFKPLDSIEGFFKELHQNERLILENKKQVDVEGVHQLASITYKCLRFVSRL